MLTKISKGDTVIWIVMIFITIISILSVFSATSLFVNGKSFFYQEIVQHSFALLFGWCIAVFGSRILNDKRLLFFGAFLMIFSMFFIFFLQFPSIAPQIPGYFELVKENEAARWVKVFGFQFQPSELSKLGLIICGSYLLTAKPSESFIIAKICQIFNITDENSARLEKIRFLITATLCFGTVAFVLPENLSTALLMGIIFFCMLFFSGIAHNLLKNLSIFLFIIGVAFILLLTLMPKETTQNWHKEKTPILHRVHTWQNRIKDHVASDEFEYNEKTAQTIHSKIAIARGGITGIGTGKSIERNYLPQIYADFIYAIIVEEMGFIIAVLLMICYFIFYIRMVQLSKIGMEKPFHILLGITLSLMLLSQAMISIEVAMNVGPVTGQPLPFISRGRTSILICFTYIAILQYLVNTIPPTKRTTRYEEKINHLKELKKERSILWKELKK